VNFDDGFAEEGGCEEGFEGDAEMATGYTCKIEERIGDGRAGEDGPETVLLHVVVDDYLGPFHQCKVWLSF
jgi:hypothetical protein